MKKITDLLIGDDLSINHLSQNWTGSKLY